MKSPQLPHHVPVPARHAIRSPQSCQRAPRRTAARCLAALTLLLGGLTASACNGMGGVSDLEFGRGVGSLCSTDTDCDQGNYCDVVVGRCTQQKHAGDECAEARECDTDQCADGLCCDTACEGTCMACNVEGSEGQCVEHEAGTDPDGECRGTASCNGAGQCTGQHLWSHSFGDEEIQEGLRVAVDSQGNVIIAGDFYGSLSLGADPFDADSGTDIYVAKYTPDGEHIWSQRFGGYDYQHLGALVVDSADRIILGGYFQGTIDFGTPMDSVSYNDLFVAKLSPEGQVLWAKQWGGDGSQYLWDAAVDGSDNIAIAGTNVGSLSIGTDTYVRTGESYADLWLAKLDPNGNPLWSGGYGNESDQAATAVAFDGSGNLYLGGWTYGELAFGTHTVISEGATDLFLVKFNSEGVVAWANRYGDGDYQYLSDLAVDSEENVLLTGYFGGAVNFGGNQLSSTHQRDIYVAKLRPDASHAWSYRFGGEFDQESYGIAVDGEDNVFVTGMFTLSVDLGGGVLTCAGDHDAFLVKLSSAGDHVWSQPFGDLLAEEGNSVATDADGNVLLIGTYEYRIDLGGGSFDSEGLTDIFLGKFGP